MNTRVLVGATLIDGTGREPLSNATVVLVDNKIAQVGRGEAVAYDREQAEVVDLTGKTVVPGLIDMHVHLGSPEGNPAEMASASETLAALTGAQRARQALLRGVTTVRDCGSLHLTNVKLRNLIASGFIPGPRICACGDVIVMTGGHGHRMGVEVDSPDEVRKLARRNLKAGAECLKLMANGLSVNSPELSAPEMRAAVEVAHDAGLKVAAHASVWRAVENALVAGVDTIEHGYTIDAAMAERMVAQGTIVVPTLATVTRVYKQGSQFPGWREKMAAVKARIDNAMTSFRLAREAGVKFGLGTDGSSKPLLSVGEVASEARALSEIGLSNMEILRAATAIAAEGLAWQDRLGTVEPGKLADLTILDGDPLADLDAWRSVYMVIKDGATVVANGALVE